LQHLIASDKRGFTRAVPTFVRPGSSFATTATMLSERVYPRCGIRARA